MNLLKVFKTVFSRHSVATVYKSSNLKYNFSKFTRSLNYESMPSNKTLVQEMFNGINLTYYGKKRVNKKDVYNLLRNLNANSEILHEEPYGISLINYYGHCMPDEHPHKRLETVWRIWDLLKNNKVAFTVSHYNSLLQVLNENNSNINRVEFLKNMACEPNEETFNLLLHNSCQIGQVKEATQIIQIMKEKNYSINEFVLNTLILGHAINGGLENASVILETMRAALVPPSSSTYISLLKGLAVKGDTAELEKAVQMAIYSQFKFTSAEILEVANYFCTNGNYQLLSSIKRLIDDVVPFPRYLISEVDSLCIHLVQIDHPEAALKILETLGDSPVPDNFEYGTFIIKEMIEADKSTEKIIKIALELYQSNKNKMALQNAAEIALQQSKVEIALAGFEKMKEFGLPLRPHYFWPLLLHTGKFKGEEVFFEVFKKMNELQVHADLSTLEYYILPYCNLTVPSAVIQRIQQLNYTVTELLTPLSIVLLRNYKIIECSVLCLQYKTKISGDHLIKPLAEAWKNNFQNMKHISQILRIICQTNDLKRDWTGEFLYKCMKMSRNKMNHDKFYKLVQMVAAENLKISLQCSENLKQLVRSSMGDNFQLANSVLEAIDRISDVTINTEIETSYIPHPRLMNTEELECHLLELKSKNMETRGLLRKLIQMQCRAGNVQRVEELYEEYKTNGYSATPGMVSNLLDLHVKSGNLSKSDQTFDELASSHRNFKLDDFKIVDYATLLLTNGRYEDAVEMLKFDNIKRSTVSGIERNVWRLLNAQAENKDVPKMKELYELLVERNFCNPTNIILGPLIRVHLVSNDLDAAVSEYTRICNVHKRTPLQHELMCNVLQADRQQLLQQVVDATERVHGQTNTRAALASALCECELSKPVRKLLIEHGPTIQNALALRYTRWEQEDKVQPLLTLAKAAVGISGFEIDPLHMSIMKIYNLRNDCDGALQFLRDLDESEQTIQAGLLNILKHMFKSNKRDLPPDVISKIKDIPMQVVMPC